MRVRRARFGDAGPLPGYVLDQLFASMTPLFTRWTEVAAAAQTAWADASVKAAWMGSLAQANQMMQDASIDGQSGQRLAMGDLSLSAWTTKVDSAADLVEYVGREIGLASYSVSRLWHEVVVPTVEDIGNKVPQIPKLVFDWGPVVLVGAGVVILSGWVSSARRTFSGYRARRRRRA